MPSTRFYNGFERKNALESLAVGDEVIEIYNDGNGPYGEQKIRTVIAVETDQWETNTRVELDNGAVYSDVVELRLWRRETTENEKPSTLVRLYPIDYDFDQANQRDRLINSLDRMKRMCLDGELDEDDLIDIEAFCFPYLLLVNRKE